MRRPADGSSGPVAEDRESVEKRSQLHDYDLSFLKWEIKKKGFNQVAKELDVHNTTLRRYIKKQLESPGG